MRPLDRLPFEMLSEQGIIMSDLYIPKHLVILSRLCFNLEKDCRRVIFGTEFFEVYYIRT